MHQKLSIFQQDIDTVLTGIYMHQINNNSQVSYTLYPLDRWLCPCQKYNNTTHQKHLSKDNSLKVTLVIDFFSFKNTCAKLLLSHHLEVAPLIITGLGITKPIYFLLCDHCLHIFKVIRIVKKVLKVKRFRFCNHSS